MECSATYGNGLVVVGTTNIVIQRHGLPVLHILNIHVVYGVLVLRHHPLTFHNPCRFTTGLITNS